MPKCKEQLINSLHNLGVSYEKLCAEYWVIKVEGGHETADQLAEVCEKISEKIKYINAELAILEAME